MKKKTVLSHSERFMKRKHLIYIFIPIILAILIGLFVWPVSLVRQDNYYVYVSRLENDGDRVEMNGTLDEEAMAELKTVLETLKCHRSIEPQLVPSYQVSKARYEVFLYYPDIHKEMTIILGLPDDPGEDSVMNKGYFNMSSFFHLCWVIHEPEALIAYLDGLFFDLCR